MFSGDRSFGHPDMGGNPAESISHKGFVSHSVLFIDSPVLCSNEGKHVWLNYLSMNPPGLEGRICCGSYLLEMYIWWHYEKGPSQALVGLLPYGT